MPTNEERYEVAAKLREHQHSDVRYPTFEGGMIASWLRFKEALGVEGDDPQEDHTMMFEYLADLIEPEERTCRIVARYEAKSIAEIGRERVKLSCGHIVERHSKFCSQCGAKVMRDN